MTNELKEIIDKCRTCAKIRGEATLEGDSDTANMNYDKLIKLLLQIRKFGNDGHAALLSLTYDENPSVRCWAATHSLKYDERKAKKTLKEVAKGKDIIAFNAKMVLKEWKKGALQIP